VKSVDLRDRASVQELEEIRTKLEKLTEPQLVELFFQVANRFTVGSFSETSSFEDKPVVAYSSYDFQDGKHEGTLSVACVHDPDVYGLGMEFDVFCQSGTCSNCGVSVISYAKKMICRLCGSKVYGT